MLIVLVFMCLPGSPHVYMQTKRPVQGVWVSSGKYVLTVQNHPTYLFGILLYRPGNIYPDSMVLCNDGRLQLHKGE